MTERYLIGDQLRLPVAWCGWVPASGATPTARRSARPTSAPARSWPAGVSMLSVGWPAPDASRAAQASGPPARLCCGTGTRPLSWPPWIQPPPAANTGGQDNVRQPGDPLNRSLAGRFRCSGQSPGRCSGNYPRAAAPARSWGIRAHLGRWIRRSGNSGGDLCCRGCARGFWGPCVAVVDRELSRADACQCVPFPALLAVRSFSQELLQAGGTSLRGIGQDGAQVTLAGPDGCEFDRITSPAEAPGSQVVDLRATQEGTTEMNALPNIVLVHGAWADGSSWSAVIERLQADGYNVTAPQFPMTALADDVARLRQVLARQNGSTIVAGHSYGGQIITALGTDAPNVVGLVYIAAFGLDEGESIGALLSQGPVTPALAHLSHRQAGLRLAARGRLREPLRG